MIAQTTHNHSLGAMPLNMAMIAMGIVLLFLGGMLYVLYRPQTLLLFLVADGMGLTNIISDWRLAATATWQPAKFIIYCLPAGLWTLSYIFIVGTLAQEMPAKKRWAAVSAIPLLGAVSELLQAGDIVPGTFDWADLALYVLPLAVYTVLNFEHSNIKTIKGHG